MAKNPAANAWHAAQPKKKKKHSPAGRVARDWGRLKEDFILMKLANPSTTLREFAKQRSISYGSLRIYATQRDENWLIAYENRAVLRDDVMAMQGIESHANVIAALRKRMVFTEEHVRGKNAAIAGALRAKIEKSLMGRNFDLIAVKDLVPLYKALHDIEVEMLGIEPAAKHSVHHHIAYPSAHLLPENERAQFKSPEEHQAAFEQRQALGHKVLAYLERQSKTIDGTATRVAEKAK